jgi:hypothetical protein
MTENGSHLQQLEGLMKTDAHVKKYMTERANGASQEVAALRADMSAKTGRKYERLGQLPSEAKTPHTWRSRADPFADDWPWVVEQLDRDAALQATTLFGLLCAQHPERYQPTQLRTLQRHIAQWRALHGPDRAVMFEQVHTPGEALQSDFTHMAEVQVTIAGEPFPHLLYHGVLTYSNVEAVRICFGETFEALAEGIEQALWQFGGAPATHRTDHLGAAIHPLPQDEQEAFKERYAALMRYYGIQPTLNNTGVAHENGDVESSHRHFKTVVDQALRVRGSREFASRGAYERFLGDLVRRRNDTRQARFHAERDHLLPLPTAHLAPCRELRVTVSPFSTLQILGNTYSVPSRLIGTEVLVRVRAEQLEGYIGSTCTLRLPRLQGKGGHAIDYHHLIWSLVRKPGAFAHYRFRDACFPSLRFRQAYDALVTAMPTRADAEYLRILYLAATTHEAEVDAALHLLLDSQMVPRYDAVRDLVHPPQVPTLVPLRVDLRPYDALLGRRCHG